MNMMAPDDPSLLRPSTPSVDEALRAVDLLLNDGSDDEYDADKESGDGFVGSLLNYMPTFSSKGNFAGYERREAGGDANNESTSISMSGDQQTAMDEFLSDPSSMKWEVSGDLAFVC